ncbi:MAG: hypothetical protein HeimAB125_05900 [Candidatus Heimdallarchaeota archaeon AB_125]|nr:MAG: hypothetical protein HeimAB125_05900 [Candidatus Heimdallarchaeota archaeon AB_125]
MSEKRKFNIWIPDSTAESTPDLTDLVDQLIYYYPYLMKVDCEELKKKKDLEKESDEVNAEFFQISQVHGKLRQEYGVVHFEANELYTRNTLTGLKLGMLMKKLNRAKSIWGEKLNLDYDSAKEMIKHYSDRYLLKKEEEI